MEELQSDPAGVDDRSLKTAESLRALRAQADQTLDSHRQQVSEIEARLNEQLALISEELARERLVDEETQAVAAEQAALLEQLQQTLAEREAEIEATVEQLAAQSQGFEAQIAERDEELEQLLELHEEETQRLESLQQELESARQTLEAVKTEECTECFKTREELNATQQEIDQLKEQIRTLEDHQGSQQNDLEATRQALQTAQEQRDQATDALAEAGQRLEELSKFEANDEQLEQTRRKFELALADVHKLKRENAELHEELLSRPEADDQESPELMSLRAERDALAERVSELEQAPQQTDNADSQQELEDLQRRFELAVDDVRQLKQENAELEQKLAAAPTAVKAGDADEPQDWQAQKARLLASLDAEDQGTVNEARQEERATIEGTISITDRVVAEKDALLAQREAELSDLQQQMESRPLEQDLDELREEIAAEILGDDEAVKAECEKLQQQQEELEAKLREAELEISVQRATLAREQAALEEKLEVLSGMMPEDQDPTAEKPRRRWLSALGIKDEEEN